MILAPLLLLSSPPLLPLLILHIKKNCIPFHSNKTATQELDNFAKILEAEGVKVRRPEVTKGDFNQPYETPDFKCKNGLYAAMPRDVLIGKGR